ncbi:hypothetical protein M569_13642, partial [Genlisea aurea]
DEHVDSWYDDESSHGDSSPKVTEMAREWQRRHDRFHTIGYRDGLIAGKEASAQERFNIGFKDSVFIGHDFGRVKGITSAMTSLPGRVMEELVEDGETREAIRRLHRSVQSEDSMKAANLGEENNGASLAESYKVQLQALLGD